MRFIYCCQTDTGTERKNNQDSLVVKSRVTREHTVVLAAVCDGVGGLACGDMASRKAADMLSNWFDYELPQIMVQPLLILICLVLLFHNCSNNYFFYIEIKRQLFFLCQTAMASCWSFQTLNNLIFGKAPA